MPMNSETPSSPELIASTLTEASMAMPYGTFREPGLTGCAEVWLGVSSVRLRAARPLASVRPRPQLFGFGTAKYGNHVLVAGSATP